MVGMSERVRVERAGSKGRAFEARLVGSVVSSMLEGYKSDDKIMNPTYAVLLGDESSLRAIVANMKTGRKLWLIDRPINRRAHTNPYPTLELTKKTKWSFYWQHMPEGSTVQIFNNDLIEQDPGLIDPDEIKFVAPVVRHWCDNQNEIIAKVDPYIGEWCKTILETYWQNADYNERKWHERANSLVYCATTFCLYADRRSRVPILPSLRFQVRLFLECLKAGIVRYSSANKYQRETFGENGPVFTSDNEALGFVECLQCRSNQEAFEAVVARVVNQTEISK